VLTEVRVSLAELVAQRPPGAVDDVHFCESLAAALIEEFTEPGDTVLDPFAGYGTSLLVAQRMGRHAIGIELLPERAKQIRQRSGADATLHIGDVREKIECVKSGVRLCLTSPPYMTAVGHPENPLTGYSTLDGDYSMYLEELATIFAQVATLIDHGGRLVINVADQGPLNAPTPLVADIKTAISRHLDLERAIPVIWDVPPAGIYNDTCLVFRSLAD
jgi:hypothetical protein